ncbi:Ig-like domain-containing protein [Planctomycetota bacterium]|nr:Ig-like domain-containing protein [Planctomycetota bacterium]
MHNKIISSLSFFLMLCIITTASAAPPNVLKITPENGKQDVDPKTNKIIIVFDQNMNRRSWSVTGGGDHYPELNGKMRWTSARTFMIPVKLKPDHDYVFGINSKSYKNFKSHKDEAVEPVVVRFRTAKAGGNTSQAKQVQEDVVSAGVTSQGVAGNASNVNAPKIVTITPAIGDEDVDPNLKEIIVTFDKPMTGGRSMTGGGVTFPEIKKIYWRDAKTFVAEVELFEDHEYRFGVNSKSHRNFRGKNGVSVEPTLVTFKTRKGRAGEVVRKMPTEPPKVVSITPEDGSQGVDPNTKEIVITFDQPMSGGRSVTGGGDAFPEINGQLQWRDEKTFVMPVKLKANHTYQFGVNSPSHQNFKSRYGKPVQWRRVSFKTRGFNQAEIDEHEIAIGSLKILSAVEQKEAWRKLGELMETQYSYRDRMGIKWAEMCESMAGEVTAARPAELLVEKMRWLLSHARDMHLGIAYEGKRSGTSISYPKHNSNVNWVLSQLSEQENHARKVISAKTPDGFGYIWVGSLSGNLSATENGFYEALRRFKDAPGVILDLRSNGGGDEILGRKIAGCFIKGQLAYAKNISVNPESETGFSDVHTRYLNQNDSGPAFDGKVAVLIGGRCVSSCEALVLMMKAAPNATLIGDRTRGSSGNPQRHDVIDGIQVSLPSWQAMTMDEVCFEGEGIEPDVWVRAEADEFEDGDPVFEAGVKFLESNK